jgi:hypothetical protein
MLVKIIGANLGSVKMFSTLGSVKMFSTLGSVKMFSDINCKENIDNVSLSLIQKDVLTGLLLSDGMLTKRNKGTKGKASFSLTQTCNSNSEYVLGHVELLFYTFNLFNNYINSPIPMSNWARTKNKLYPYLYFNTITTNEFLAIYNIWYVNNKKTVPKYIDLDLTPRALAFWAMGDGGKSGAGFHLNTNAFGDEGANTLRKALLKNFNLSTSLHSRHRIYIPSSEIDKFRDIVRMYILPGFLYKLD